VQVGPGVCGVGVGVGVRGGGGGGGVLRVVLCVCGGLAGAGKPALCLLHSPCSCRVLLQDGPPPPPLPVAGRTSLRPRACLASCSPP
jgi:hypothetical protein